MATISDRTFRYCRRETFSYTFLDRHRPDREWSLLISDATWSGFKKLKGNWLPVKLPNRMTAALVAALLRHRRLVEQASNPRKDAPQETTMNVYSVDVSIVGTIYIKASSVREAAEKLAAKRDTGLDLKSTASSETPVSEAKYEGIDLPEISLSPAMTLKGHMGPFSLVADLVPGTPIDRLAAPPDPFEGIDWALAEEEGWSLFEVSREDAMFEIQKIDDLKVFASDDEAFAFVARKAAAGSEYHNKVLVALRRADPPTKVPNL